MNPTETSAEYRDWSSSINHPLHSVVSRLSSLEDLFSFRAVCRSWRSLPTTAPAPPLSAQPPLLLLSRFPSSDESFYDLLRSRLYSTRFPFRRRLKSIRLNSTRLPFSGRLNSIRLPCRSLAFSHGFLITVSDDSDSASASTSERPELLLWNLLSGLPIRLPKSHHCVQRVILSSSPASSSPACSVVCFWPRSNSFQFCSLGDRLWEFHTSSNAPIYDMIFFRGRLYALTPDFRLATVDLTPRPPEFTLLGPSIDPNSNGPGNKNYWKWMLAKSGAESDAESGAKSGAKSDPNLLLVGIYGDPMRFSVFRWDFEGGGGWRELLDLGGRSLFLDLSGFAASVVPTCPAVKGNCIYYVDHCKSAYYEFSLEDQSLATISLDPSLRSHVPKIWVFPSLCCF